MQRIRTLQTTLLIQFWFHLIFTGLGGIALFAAIMIPNLLAAREQAQRTAAMAGLPGPTGSGFGPTELGVLLITGIPALLITGVIIALPLLIRRGLRGGRDVTTLLWVNIILNILNIPVGTVLAILQIMQITDKETGFLIRQGQAQAA